MRLPFGWRLLPYPGEDAWSLTGGWVLARDPGHLFWTKRRRHVRALRLRHPLRAWRWARYGAGLEAIFDHPRGFDLGFLWRAIEDSIYRHASSDPLLRLIYASPTERQDDAAD